MHPNSPADHARHDTQLIAGHAAGDLSDRDRIAADALLASCSACADLRRDLVAIAAATRSMPSPVAARDFRLTADQAGRLRRGSWLRGFLRPFAAPGTAVHPMAAAFTTLGIAGLFVATIAPGLFGSAGTAQRDLAGGAQVPAPAASAAAVPEAAGAPGASTRELQATQATARTAVDAASPPGDRYAAANAGQSAGATQGTAGEAAGGRTNPTDTRDEAKDLASGVGTPSAPGPTASPLVLGSLGLLALGLLMFGLRFAARRVR